MGRINKEFHIIESKVERFYTTSGEDPVITGYGKRSTIKKNKRLRVYYDEQDERYRKILKSIKFP